MARALSPRRAAEVRAALQMAAGATAALYLATWLRLPHPYWSVISAIVVIQTSVGGGVLTVARDRAIGTASGALVGALVAFVRPPGLESLALAVAVATATLAFLGAGRPWLKVAPVTATIVIAGGSGADGPASLAIDRLMEILVGSGVGVIAILALFPRHARQAFGLQARDAAGEAAVLLALVCQGDPANAAEISRRHTDLKRRLDDLGKAAKNVIDLPGPQRETADRQALTRAFWRVRSDIVILGRGFQAEGASARLTPWAEDASRAVQRLEALSRGKPVEPLGPIDATLALSRAVEGDDMALGAAAIGLAHMHRDLDDLAGRFQDLRLV
ncbi:FUSC family protein [Brevundimonas sp.]|uniref:FUSC family protein n=1 Tax=Brevundimonas sp. TaxID=1871086 RepID=UPI0028A1CE2B|nr:FUSC family protein [Brevundimonas sp.]